MKFNTAALFSLALAAAADAQFTIFTPPSVVQCLPALLSWQEGTAPYFLSILPGGQPSAPPIVDLGRQTGMSVTWLVNIPGGTSIGLTIRDSTGAIAQSSPITIQNSSDTSCLNQTVSTGAGPAPTSGGGGTTTPPATTTSPPGTTGGSTTSPGTTSPGTTGTGSGTTTAGGASNTNAAVEMVAQAGVVGIVGAVLAAVLA